MKSKVMLFVFLALAKLSLPSAVIAGNPPLPSQDFINYMNTGKIIVLILTFIFLLIINTKISSLIFKKYNIFIPIKKLIIFSLIITILSNITHHLFYSMVLPDAYSPGLFSGNSVIRGIISTGNDSPFSQTIILAFFILNPSYLLSFLTSYLFSNLLLKNYLKVTNYKRKIASIISLTFLPFLGIIIALFLSELFYLIFPFVGNKF